MDGRPRSPHGGRDRTRPTGRPVRTTVRKAAATVDKRSLTYSVLRTAAAELHRLTPAPQYDVDNEFVAFTDVHTVWPKRRRPGLAASPAPWTREFDAQAWQLRHLTPWLPTRAEQDAKWLEVYAGEHKAQQEALRSTVPSPSRSAKGTEMTDDQAPDMNTRLRDQRRTSNEEWALRLFGQDAATPDSTEASAEEPTA